MKRKLRVVHYLKRSHRVVLYPSLTLTGSSRAERLPLSRSLLLNRPQLVSHHLSPHPRLAASFPFPPAAPPLRPPPHPPRAPRGSAGSQASNSCTTPQHRRHSSLSLSLSLAPPPWRRAAALSPRGYDSAPPVAVALRLLRLPATKTTPPPPTPTPPWAAVLARCRRRWRWSGAARTGRRPAAAGRRRWTRASTCATPPSRSRRSSASTASAPNPARCAGSSSSGSAPYSATSSPSRSRSGSRTAGACVAGPLSVHHLTSGSVHASAYSLTNLCAPSCQCLCCCWNFSLPLFFFLR
jgi:hypothetical protein